MCTLIYLGYFERFERSKTSAKKFFFDFFISSVLSIYTSGLKFSYFDTSVHKPKTYHSANVNIPKKMKIIFVQFLTILSLKDVVTQSLLNLMEETNCDIERERTFIMIKPDAVQRGLIGEIIQRFERKGFKLVAMKLLQVYWTVIFPINFLTHILNEMTLGRRKSFI